MSFDIFIRNILLDILKKKNNRLNHTFFLPLMTLRMGAALWGGEDIVQKRAEEAEGTLSDVLKFFTTQVQLEEKYSKSFRKVGSQAKNESGSIGVGWQAIRDQQSQQLAQNYAISASKINSEIVTPLESARKKYFNDKSRLANDIAQLKKEMHRRSTVLGEKKQSYWNRCEAHHKEKKKFDEMVASNQASKIAKFQAVYQKAKAEMDQSEKEYRDYIVEYNHFKSKYEEAMRSFLNEYEQLDLDRLKVLSEVLKK
jgi:hypothetical protein